MISQRSPQLRRTRVSLVPHATVGDREALERFARASALVIELQERRRRLLVNEGEEGRPEERNEAA